MPVKVSVAASAEGSVAVSAAGSVAVSAEGSVAVSAEGSVAVSAAGSVAESAAGSVAASVGVSVAASVGVSVAPASPQADFPTYTQLRPFPRKESTRCEYLKIRQRSARVKRCADSQLPGQYPFGRKRRLHVRRCDQST